MLEPGDNVRWRRSSRCNHDDHCVEVAHRAHDVGVRSSTTPGESPLFFGSAAWAGFVTLLTER